MKRLITEQQKIVACYFAMPSGWNPLGNPDIFKSIQKNIFNYFLKKKHNLTKNQIIDVEKYYEQVIKP